MSKEKREKRMPFILDNGEQIMVWDTMKVSFTI
jgi:hypothetical protein